MNSLYYMTSAKNPYKLFIDRIIPIILTKLDRDQTSPTYGCFDRLYWHYKIRDFVSMIEQQPVLALTLLYHHDFEGNVYYKNETIKEYAIAAINFWANNIHKDGSADEYWPNEHGYPPSVFPLFAISESYRLLIFNNNKVRKAMLNGAKFISKQIEKGPVNQEVASIAALYSVYLNTKKKWLLKSINKKLNFVIKIQNSEGWFPEYGGADPGYLSVALDYIAEYYQLSKDKRVVPIIEKILNFIQYFVHPDGSFGGDYGSRNTEYFLPNGLEILAYEFPLAAKIADKLSENIDKINHLHNGIDDRYLCDYFARSFVGALVNYNRRKINNIGRKKMPKKLSLPYETTGDKYFKNAQLFLRNTDEYYIIISLAKGGVIKVYNKKGIIFSDCGYIVKFDEKSRYCNNWLNQDYQIKTKENYFNIHGTFHRQKENIQTPLKSFLIRISAFVLHQHIIPILKKVMITTSNKSFIHFTRSIQINGRTIIIKDEITSPKKIINLYSVNRFSLRYVPSSRFFQHNDIKIKNKERAYYNLNKFMLVKELNITKQEELIIKEKMK